MGQTAPAHECYRPQLEVAHTDAPLLAAIFERADCPAWLPQGRPVRRTYGRFFAGAAPYLVIVFETLDTAQALFTVEVFEERPKDAGTWLIRFDPLGWLRIAPANRDPQLPALAGLMDLRGSRVVRYRPGKRCVVRVDETDRTTWAKIFADDHGEVVHRTDLLLWKHRSELTFSVAPPGRYEPATRTLWKDHVHGEPVMPALMEAGGPAMANRMGRACGSLARSALIPERALLAAHELERTTLRARLLADAVPSLAGQLEELLRLLRPTLSAAGGRELRAIHGAPHPDQWLHAGSRLGLVDFDRMGLGDPELDVATFQAEIDFKGGIVAGRDEINSAFLEGYELVSGPLNRRLLAGYLAAKRMHKAVRTAQAIRPDGDQRATAHLERALAAVV